MTWIDNNRKIVLYVEQNYSQNYVKHDLIGWVNVPFHSFFWQLASESGGADPSSKLL